MKKIVIAGGSGFMGLALANYYAEKNYYVIILTRNLQNQKTKLHNNIEFVLWDGKTEGDWCKELMDAEILVNLSGKSVDCRYNERNKKEIFASRLDSTKVLGNFLTNNKTQIKVWMNAASATIYRHSLDTPMTEDKVEYGTGFSVEVCQAWEQTFYSFKHLNIRQVALRTAIVLGEEGGVMVPFKRLAQFFMAGNLAGGKQMFSWIHIRDFCRIVDFIEKNESIEGSINVSNPNPVRNTVLMHALRRKYNVLKIGIPQPLWLLKFGAWLIRTEIELIVKSRFVIPEKLMKSGFVWDYINLEESL